jgi:nucleotide-binding universal stress UspA family protein
MYHRRWGWTPRIRVWARGRRKRIVSKGVVLDVVTGRILEAAFGKTDWEEGKILAVGTRPRGEIRRVFLGSRSSKIIRESAVPVLVLPG